MRILMFQSLRIKYIKSILNNIENYVKTNYEYIPESKMVLGCGVFNSRCHYNAVHHVYTNDCDGVISCIAINKYDTNDIVVHFINKKDDNFTDNTLGYLYEEYDYYMIRDIGCEEYAEINDMLGKIKRTIFNTCSNRVKNVIFNIDYHLI